MCSGNTCRSPLAEAILRRWLPAGGEALCAVASAGTAAVKGAPASDGALVVAAREGLSLRGHRARRLTREMVIEADLVLVMEPGHRRAVLALDPSAGERTHLLTGFADALAPGEGEAVRDPLGGGEALYAAVYGEIAGAIERSLARILALAEDSR